MFVAISAAGVFRSDDAGETWRPANQGLRSEGSHPGRRRRKSGHCVHRIAMHPSQARRAVHAEALGRHAQRRRRQLLAGCGRGPYPADFGFCIDVHAHEPETHLSWSQSRATREHYPPEASCGSTEPYRRARVGAADQRPAAGKLLRERVPRRHGRRFARALRGLFRHHRRPGLRVCRRGRQLGSARYGTCRRSFPSKPRRCHDRTPASRDPTAGTGLPERPASGPGHAVSRRQVAQVYACACRRSFGSWPVCPRRS